MKLITLNGTTLHYIAPCHIIITSHHITLHYTTLHYTTLHYTTLHYTTPHHTTRHHTTHYHTTPHHTTPHHTTPHHTTKLTCCTVNFEISGQKKKALCRSMQGYGRHGHGFLTRIRIPYKLCSLQVGEVEENRRKVKG